MTLAAFLSRFAWIIAAWAVVHAYIAIRLAKPVRGWKRLAVVAFVLLIAFLPPITLWLDRTGVAFGLKDTLRWVGFTSIGFSSLLAFVFAAEDVVRIFGRLVALVR